MSELKPCPFCGGEVEVLSDMHRTWGLVMHRDGCFFSNFRLHVIPEYDFEAWNTRHVETCKRFWTGAEMVCSKCGYQLNSPVAKFCPSCGREVEG